MQIQELITVLKKDYKLSEKQALSIALRALMNGRTECYLAVDYRLIVTLGKPYEKGEANYVLTPEIGG